MRRWILIIVVAMAVVLLTAGYIRRDAPRPDIAQTVGVLPRTPFKSKYCGWFMRDISFGTIPTGGVRCTWYRPSSAARRAERDQLFYHVISRHVKYADRSWEPTSRARWQQDVDSVRNALKARGGVRVCEQWQRRSQTEIREFWRFSGFDVMLLAGSDTLSLARLHGEPSWAVFLHADPRRWCS